MKYLCLMMIFVSTPFAGFGGIDESEYEYIFISSESLGESRKYFISKDDFEVFYNNFKKIKEVEAIPEYLCGGGGILIGKVYKNNWHIQIDSPCTGSYSEESEFHIKDRGKNYQIKITKRFIDKMKEIFKREPDFIRNPPRIKLNNPK